MTDMNFDEMLRQTSDAVDSLLGRNDCDFDAMLSQSDCVLKIIHSDDGVNFWVVHFIVCHDTVVYRESYTLGDLECYMMFPNTVSFEEAVHIVQVNINHGLFC